MMHGHEKSDLAIVAGKSANNVAPRCGAIRGGVSRSGVDGAKGGDQGECEPAKHVPGAEPDKRVTGAGSHAATTPHLGFSLLIRRMRSRNSRANARIAAKRLGGVWHKR